MRLKWSETEGTHTRVIRDMLTLRYFFIKDRVDKGEVTVEYCPTHHMIADYFTKPLQGRVFQKFRNIIMGYEKLSALQDDSFTLKERVEN